MQPPPPAGWHHRTHRGHHQGQPGLHQGGSESQQQRVTTATCCHLHSLAKFGLNGCLCSREFYEPTEPSTLRDNIFYFLRRYLHVHKQMLHVPDCSFFLFHSEDIQVAQSFIYITELQIQVILLDSVSYPQPDTCLPIPK